VQPLEVLQELGGWSDYKMVKRYAHFTHQHLKQYVNCPQTGLATKSATLALECGSGGWI